MAKNLLELLLILSVVAASRRDLAFGNAYQSNFPRADTNAIACSQLESSSPSQVVTAQNGSTYDLLRRQQAPTAWESPTCIYSPTTVDELGNALNALSSTNATLAIRGHGHSPLPGWASINGGVLIDMKAINNLEYDSSSTNVRAGFGNSWGQVYSYLENFGRLALGARSPSVGLATILGGGLSHLSNAYGFVSDNVVSFEFLSANGTLFVANSTSNTDVFFALKGGSNNFGIVTHVTLRTYAVGKVWGGALIFTNDYRDEIMRAFATYQQSGQLDTKSALLSYMGITNNTNYVILAYLGEVERPTAFKPFFDIPTIFDGTRMHDNFTDLISEQVDRVVPRWTLGATTYYLDEATYVDVGRIAQNASAILSSINGGSMVLMPQPISQSMIAESTSRGASPMVSNLNATAQMWLCVNIGWNFAEDDAKIEAILVDTLKQIEDLTKARKLYHEFIFANDAHYTQYAPRRYGQNVFRKLLQVSRLVDPTGFFQKNAPGGFKLVS